MSELRNRSVAERVKGEAIRALVRPVSALSGAERSRGENGTGQIPRGSMLAIDVTALTKERLSGPSFLAELSCTVSSFLVFSLQKKKRKDERCKKFS